MKNLSIGKLKLEHCFLKEESSVKLNIYRDTDTLGGSDMERLGDPEAKAKRNRKLKSDEAD